MIKKTIIIGRNSGIDIKLAGKISRNLQKFDCKADLIVRGNKYNARSILSLVSAAIVQHDNVEIIFSGEQEKECVLEFENIINI